MITRIKTSEHAKKITDNFLSAIYGSFARDVFEKSITKKVPYFRFKCSCSNVLQELYAQVGNFLLQLLFII